MYKLNMIVTAVILCVPLLPALAATASWSCGLASSPLINIPISPEQQQEILRQQQQHSLGGNRNLLRVPFLVMDAIVVPGGIEHNQHRRQATTGDENSTSMSLFDHPTAANATNSTTTGIIVYHEGRECGCADNFLFTKGLITSDIDFFCPMPANQCSVWLDRNGDDGYDFGVHCYQNMTWSVTTARQLWYYIVFWFVLLALYPIFTRPGHHAIKYLLSKCFPRMNVWITEQLLQDEIRTNERIRQEFERAIRLRRQREGEVTGYSIKTKTFTAIKKDRLHSTLGGDTFMDAVEASIDGINMSKCSEESAMCTICLLELEDGDLIADLGCGHFYHAECLGEWVLKKNSCPLCQDQGVATEIRYYETADDGNVDQVESCGSRWRRKTRQILLSIATGGHPPTTRADQTPT